MYKHDKGVCVSVWVEVLFSWINMCKKCRGQLGWAGLGPAQEHGPGEGMHLFRDAEYSSNLSRTYSH